MLDSVTLPTNDLNAIKKDHRISSLLAPGLYVQSLQTIHPSDANLCNTELTKQQNAGTHDSMDATLVASSNLNRAILWWLLTLSAPTLPTTCIQQALIWHRMCCGFNGNCLTQTNSEVYSPGDQSNPQDTPLNLVTRVSETKNFSGEYGISCSNSSKDSRPSDSNIATNHGELCSHRQSNYYLTEQSNNRSQDFLPEWFNTSNFVTEIKAAAPLEQAIFKPVGKRSASRMNYKCSHCGRVFSKAYNRTIHERTHTDERPFSCKICSRRFRRKDHLRDHSYTHLTSKPFICTICNRGFCQSRSLDNHKRTNHLQVNANCNKVEILPQHTQVGQFAVFSQEMPKQTFGRS